MFNFLDRLLNGPDTPKQATGPDDTHLALAVLLFDAAQADGECSEEEKELLIHILISRFGVAKDSVEQLLQARKKEREEHVDIFRYTRFMNDTFSEEEKIRVIESVWQIILSDGRLEAHEDHFAHRLADLLWLNHTDLIQAKKRAREKLFRAT